MSRVITLEISDDAFNENPRVVGSIIGDASYLDAKIEVRET